MRIFLLVVTLSTLLNSCSQKVKVDLLVYNAIIYTIDSSFSIAEAIAIRDGKIVEVGKTTDLQNKYDTKEKLDAEGKFIYPGFIDAHAHFFGYGNSLQNANLVGTESWEAILEVLKKFEATHSDGWLLGRGWDQNDWPIKDFPDNEKLNELFPDRPVLLTRVDGHAAIANSKALELAGLKPGDKLKGGEIEVKNGKLTGILVDNAVGLVRSKVPSQSDNNEMDVGDAKSFSGRGLYLG